MSLLEPSIELPREHDMWFRALAETTSTAIIVYSAERVLFVNRAVEELTGFTAAELLTFRPWDLAHPELRPLVRERLAARLRGEPVPNRYEVRVHTRDGAERWVDVTSAVIEPINGQGPTGMATAVDITERKLAEVALRESGARLELAQRAAGIATWEWNLLTDELIVPAHAAELFGCSPSQLWTTGRELLGAIHPEDHETLAGALRLCLQAGRDLSFEVRIRAPGGAYRWFNDRGQAVCDATGSPVRMIGVIRDITARKQSEERLRAIVEGTSSTTGAGFLRSLVRHLADALGTRFAFIAEVAGPEGLRARILAFWTGEEYGEPFEYDVRGTPCENVIGRQFCYYPSDAWRLFPQDAWLREEGIESYFAVPLFDSDDRPLGHMAVMDSKPLAEDLPAMSILKIFAARAGAEIERKLAEEALAQEKERAQVTLASIGDGVIRTDAAGVIDYLNPVAERLTGWSAAEASGQPVLSVFNVVDETTGRPVPNLVERCLQEGQVVELPGYSLLIRRDGGEAAIRDSVAPIRDRHGRITGTVLVFKDVTLLRGMEREMVYLARHDPLTGLINRREFERRLQHCLTTAREEKRLHALFYLDLDEFKVVNDTCGHLAGDEMLKQVTGLLKSRLRKTDTLARLGGDEFGVLLEDTQPDRARAVGLGLRTAVQQFRFSWQERIFEIGVSIGFVPLTPETADMAHALSAADAACYVAKENGRNRMHEYQPDDSALAERYGEMQWVHRIHKAFAEHRFCLYHQPIMPLSAAFQAEPRLCEIFIRMIEEDGRLASPAAFIPAAERYHLIGSIDRWVVHAAFVSLACRALSHEDDTCFAINLSGQSLGDDAFLEYVLEEIEVTGVLPRRVCFEITETAAVENLEQAVAFIRVLKSHGCRFVLDDFGSGLSSFAYLKNLQVDYLKIDGTFVRDMVGSPVQRALVESIHQIGQVMGIRTIAESVENRASLEMLREIGVDYVQGFGVAMPEPLS
ncbi:MAG TPA: EAL domain-containing protein [Thermoanaerobaculia bacterium]|nr:EAL domain-containing protein [Thermoanaerobaculia bacterium]